MKTASHKSPHPIALRTGLVGLALTAALLAGCLPIERAVWSPDGKRAVVISMDGLFLHDRQSGLSDLLIPKAYLAHWLPDSSEILVATVDEAHHWIDLVRHLPPARLQNLQDASEFALQSLTNGVSWEDTSSRITENFLLQDQGLDAVRMYLRDHHSDTARRHMPDPEKLSEFSLEYTRLIRATVAKTGVQTNATLAADILRLIDFRISPTEGVLAYTVMGDDHPLPDLFVVPLDGSQPAQLLARWVAVYPDWSPDGRSLAYIRSLHPAQDSEDEEVRLGTLCLREVLDEDGRIQTDNEAQELVGLMFNETGRIRWLKDGRILFCSYEFHLPSAISDFTEEMQIYSLDPSRNSTLTRMIPGQSRSELPKDLSYFTLSPDESYLAIGGWDESVSLFHIASGNVEILQESMGGEDAGVRSVPSWTPDGRLCFVKLFKATEPKEAEQPELVLWDPKKEAVLSEKWPESAREGWLE